MVNGSGFKDIGERDERPPSGGGRLCMSGRRIESLEPVFRQGESQTIELKSDVPARDVLARDMAAFANSGGGTVVVGLDDRMTRVSSPSLERVQRTHDEALRLLRPPVESQVYPFDTIRGRVVCIDVSPSRWGPVAWEGVVLHRDGTEIRAASVREVEELLGSDSSESQRMQPASMMVVAELVAAQSAKLEEIRHDQIEARTWRSRMCQQR